MLKTYRIVQNMLRSIRKTYGNMLTAYEIHTSEPPASRGERKTYSRNAACNVT